MNESYTHETMVLLESRVSSPDQCPRRLRIKHDGSRAHFIANFGEAAGVDATQLELLGSQNRWMSVPEFIALSEPVAKFLRALVVSGSLITTPTSSLVMLPWRRYGSVTFGEGLDTDLIVGGHRVRMGKFLGDVDAPHGATGKTLWDGAVLLAAFLNRYPETVRGKRVLELGAGQVRVWHSYNR